MSRRLILYVMYPTRREFINAVVARVQREKQQVRPSAEVIWKN